MKKIIASITAVALAFMQGNTVFASSSDKSSALSSIPCNPIMQAVTDSEDFGDIENFHELLNADDEVTAYCVDSEDGYVIYDECTVLEFSYSTSSPFENIEECYYFGPLNYYVKEGNEYVHIRTSQKIGASDAEASSDTYEEIKNETDLSVSDLSISTSTVEIQDYTITNHEQLRYSLSPFDYNTDNTCGSLALTIMMDYWHKYIDGYTLKSTYANDPYQLYTYLKTHIEPGASSAGYEGSTPDQIKNGYTSYSGNVLSSGRTKMSFDSNVGWGFVYSHITNNKPGIIGISNHPIYKEHWVVSSGVYHLVTDNGKLLPYYEINDGWGNNNVVLPQSYTDGYLYIS